MLLETIRDYRMIVENVDKLIEVSGCKISWIEKEMGMDNVTFYTRRKQNKFSLDELEKLLTVLRVDDYLEDKILAEMSIEDQKGGVASEEEIRAWLNEK